MGRGMRDWESEGMGRGMRDWESEGMSRGMGDWEKEGVRGQNGQRDGRLGERGNEKGDWAGR